MEFEHRASLDSTPPLTSTPATQQAPHAEEELCASAKLPRLHRLTDTITGCLLGIAVGDSLALPCEGLTAQRQARMFRGECRQRFIFGKGMISDDTEHIAMLAQALIESGGNIETFKECFAQRLKHWLAFLPGGVGFATLRATIKLWLGYSPDNSGVDSAGNGPCMRSPLLGVLFGDDLERLVQFVEASSRMTHTDGRAIAGALAVAVAAHLSATQSSTKGEEYLTELSKAFELRGETELKPLLERAAGDADQGGSTLEFARSLGLRKGVSGFVLHTVPVVIHSWLSAQNDFGEAIKQTMYCGGDTDTTSAIVGAIIGARVKEQGIPAEWIEAIWEPGFGPQFLRELAVKLSQSHMNESADSPPEVPKLTRLLRNILFDGIVLAHGFRRMLPPY